MSGTSRAKVGDKYGHLTIIEDTGRRGHGGIVIWKCKCDCGKVIERRWDCIAESLKSGRVISCGCQMPSDIGQRESNNPIRLERLRNALYPIEGTTLQGIGPQKVRRNNTSGIRGVSYVKRSGKWRARIMFQRRDISVYRDTKEEAIKARKELEDIYFKPMMDRIKEEKENEPDKRNNKPD